ncbi:MAG: hypothetical protein NTW52_06950 [Planctomycetota bacterium]|nr:hypothetical protein [Planctomycetota bacterium]
MSSTPPSLSELSVDPEGVVDLDSNSTLAVVAGLLALVGLLSAIEPSLLILSAAAALLGAVVLVFAKRWQIAGFSRKIATVAMILAAFSLGAGMTQRSFWNSYRESKAVSLAESYMDALARGDRNLAIKLVGLPPMVQVEDQSSPLSREQEAVRAFLGDYIVQEVIQRGDKASWKTTGVLASWVDDGIVQSRVGFIDTNVTNQIPIVVEVRMQPPLKYGVDNKTRWIVSSISRQETGN